jgi:hypothetical protein
MMEPPVCPLTRSVPTGTGCIFFSGRDRCRRRVNPVPVAAAAGSTLGRR